MLRVVFLGFISLVLISSTCLAQGAGDQTNPAVAYTGKTYGYLRNDVDDHPEGILATDFVERYRDIKNKYPQAILVGMGDNFAPDYRARYFRNGAVDEPVQRVNSGPPFSPAVEFFNNFDNGTGYDAMVPGQLDFYFGAEFLRRVGNGYLPMLAANLVIQSAKQPVTPQPLCAQPQLILPTQVTLPLQSGSGSGGGKGKGGGGKKGGGGGGSGSSQGSSASSSGQGGGQSGQSGQLCLQERTAEARAGETLTLVSPPADSVYPWVTEFEFSLPEGSQKPAQASLCPWKPQRSNVADCSSLENPKEGPIPSKRTYLAKVSASDRVIQKNATLLNSNSKPLHSGADIEICVPSTDGKNPFRCTSTPIHVQRVFFDRVWQTVSRPVPQGTINITHKARHSLPSTPIEGRESVKISRSYLRK
jgi:hypothetical protein